MAVNWFPLWLSLRVAAVATLVSLALGLWIAYLLANRRFRGKELLDALVTLPLVLPPTVLGYYLLVVLGRSSPLGYVYEWYSGARWCSRGRRQWWPRRSTRFRCW